MNTVALDVELQGGTKKDVIKRKERKRKELVAMSELCTSEEIGSDKVHKKKTQ